MFWVIARHHCRLLIRERVLGIGLALLVLAMGYGFVGGQVRIKQERTDERAFAQRAQLVIARNRELAAAIERRIASGAEQEQIPPPFGSRHPRYVGTWCRPPSILPPSPLSWLAVGQSDLYPTAYAGPEYDEVSQVANPVKLLNGHWDIAFTVVYLLPLFILSLSFDLIASDRETGILRLALSQPVRLWTILTAKAAAVGAIALGSVAILYALGVAPGNMHSGDGMSARAVIAGIAILAYAAFWLALALALNVFNRTATENAFILAALWLCFVVLVPFAIDQAATKLHPVPPHVEIMNIIRAAPETVKRLSGPQVIAEFLANHPELPPADGLSDLGLLYLEGAARREALQNISDVAQGRWEDSLARQESLAHRSSYASPATVLTAALTELAGTSRARYLDFLLQKREYERTYEMFFLPRRLALPNSIFRAADYDLIPTMTYREETLKAVLRRALPFVYSLLLVTMFATCAALFLAWRFTGHSAGRTRRRITPTISPQGEAVLQ